MYRFFNSIPLVLAGAFFAYVGWKHLPTDCNYLALIVGSVSTIIAAMVLSITNGRVV